MKVKVRPVPLREAVARLDAERVRLEKELALAVATRNAAQAESTRNVELRRQAERALLAVEWIADLDQRCDQCPWCKGRRWKVYTDAGAAWHYEGGHGPDCQREAALAGRGQP